MKKDLLFIGLLALSVSCISQTPKNNSTMNAERLTYFSFDHHNSMARFYGENYKVSTEKDGRIHIIIDEGFPKEKDFYIDDTTIFDELLAIVKQYQMDNYRSRYQPSMDITDGDSWSLYYKYDSKRSVSSGGYMAWPDNYGNARKALSDYFQKWRDYPMPVKEINLFQYTCHNNYGCDIEYRMERGENEAVLYMRNAELQFEKTFSVSNDNLAELQELVNVFRMKEEFNRTISDDSASVYRFVVAYSTGDAIDFQGYHTTFLGGLESAFVHFFSNWLPIQGNLVRFDFGLNHKYTKTSFLAQKEEEKYILYYTDERDENIQCEITPEAMKELQELMESFDIDRTKDKYKGVGVWYILASYDSSEHISVAGQDRERGETILKILQDFFAPYIK